MDYDDVTIDEPPRWPLHWSGLLISERWAWFDRLWQSVCALRIRYWLPVRSGWWESEPVLDFVQLGERLRAHQLVGVLRLV